MKEKSLFSSWVQQQRKLKGWTQEQLASQLGLSYARVRDIENCPPGYLPRDKTLKSMSALFGGQKSRWDIGYTREFLAPYQAEVLEGLMLGDGHLEMHKDGVTPSLKITRSLADLEYQKWLADVFSNFISVNGMREGNYFDERTQKEYHSIRLATRTSNAFEEAYKRWYPHGTKVVPVDLTLSPVIVAVWLADDGSIWGYSGYKHRNAIQGRPTFSMQLATDGFTEPEVQRLCGLLTSHYGSTFRADNSGRPDQRRIRAGRKPTIALLRDIDAVFPPMSRKSDVWRQSKDVWVDEPQCPYCTSTNVSRNGHHGEVQYWLCKACGKQYTKEQRPDKQSKVTCNVCGKAGQYVNMCRWHFENCRSKKNVS